MYKNVVKYLKTLFCPNIQSREEELQEAVDDAEINMSCWLLRHEHRTRDLERHRAALSSVSKDSLPNIGDT